MGMVSAKQLDRLLTQIPTALQFSDLNGWEMGLLDTIQARLIEYGQKCVISDNEQHRLNEIFQKAGIYPEIDQGLIDL